MGKEWTEEQQEAITVTGCNLLVAAAAGAGKTAVLVERIIRLLCDREHPTEIDRMLVVTFTEAAAAEMRERVGMALEKAIKDHGRSGLGKQLSLLNGASISTLHSFCLDVIRRYFYLIDIDPGLRVADQLEAAMLQQDVLDMVLEEAFKKKDNESFLELVARYGGKTGDESLARLILRLYQYSWSNPWPEQWLDEAANAFSGSNSSEHEEPEAALAPWLQPVRSHLKQSLALATAALGRAKRLCNHPGGPLVYESTLTAETEQLSTLEELLSGPWNVLRETWLGVSFNRLPPAKNVDEALKKQVQDYRQQAKDEIKKSLEAYFTRSLSDYLREVRELGPVVAELTGLVKQFANLYSLEKKSLALVDFNDLEHFCLHILIENKAKTGELKPSVAALELRERFDYVLVDEYQDINPVQDAILTLVSRQGSAEPNLFMVGDVKQSIYRFRLGDPSLFMDRYRLYPAIAGSTERKLLLSKNFRCRKGVVDAVNYLFRQLMTAEAAELEYDKESELVCGAHYPPQEELQTLTAVVEVYLVERTGEDPDSTEDQAQSKEDEELSAIEREGLVAARRIKALFDADHGPHYVLDKDNNYYRPISYRDIVILLRATSNRADKLVEILRRFGIPAYADLATGYFAATEVETMVSLLKVLDNPCQDIPLAAVLRSPFVGLSMEDLAEIRKAGGKGSDFYSALLKAAESDLPGLAERLVSFLARLERWRNLGRREKLAAFIARLYRESGYADYVAGLPNGAQRQANLRALFHRARQFDRFSRQGLYRFISFVDQLRGSGEDLGAARALGEKEDVVRIMSIHKSKGLEFPVVILCDLGKQFNFQDQRAEVLMHRRLGLGPVIVSPQSKVRYPSLPYLALKLLGEAETRAEEMRILYVALTRAREKLILIGSAKSMAEKMSSWQNLLEHCSQQLPPYDLVKARTYLDWLGGALIRHWDLAQGVTTGYHWQVGEESRFKIQYYGDVAGYEQSLSANPVQKEMQAAMLALQPIVIESPVEGAPIRERLAFSYPYLPSALPAKLSVSEIKRRLATGDEDGTASLVPQSWSKPAFVQAKTEHGALKRGTLTHLVMQNVDLSLPLDQQGITDQVIKMGELGIISAGDEVYVNVAQVADFFTSEAGKLVLLNKDRVHREWPFTISVAASTVLGEGIVGDDAVIVQGIIDLLLATPAGYLIMDYKTDRLPAGGLTELIDRYKEQMRYYAMAVETVMGRPVAAMYIYFFATGQTVQIFSGSTYTTMSHGGSLH